MFDISKNLLLDNNSSSSSAVAGASANSNLQCQKLGTIPKQQEQQQLTRPVVIVAAAALPVASATASGDSDQLEKSGSENNQPGGVNVKAHAQGRNSTESDDSSPIDNELTMTDSSLTIMATDDIIVTSPVCISENTPLLIATPPDECNEITTANQKTTSRSRDSPNNKDNNSNEPNERRRLVETNSTNYNGKPPTATAWAAPPLLSKTFTEPANLSELLKNLSSNLHNKLFGAGAALLQTSRIGADGGSGGTSSTCSSSVSKSSTSNNGGVSHNGRSSRKVSPSSVMIENEEKTSTVGKVPLIVSKNDEKSMISNEEENYESNFGGKRRKISLESSSRLRHGSSSFALNQLIESGSKVNSICSQCPRCRRHGHTSTLVTQIGSVRDCGCRICRLLDPATSPTLVARQLPSSESMELGALCQLCGQSGSAQPPAGRCLRYTMSASGQVQGQPQQQQETTMEHGINEPPTDTASVHLMTSVSFNSGPVTSREQGVQVSKWSLSSISSCSGPLCRICHSPGDKIEPLMSPCRCSGSLKFVHASCLLRWLEISRRKLHRAPHCELCGYKYQRHKIMRFRRFQCPPCSRRDKLLHFTFILAILIMVVCASTTIICFKAERGQKIPSDKIELTSQEVVTLVCGVMFFCAFFLAMYVQVKAQATIYKLILRFWLMNQEWQIEEYRRERDAEYYEKYRPVTAASGAGAGTVALTITEARSTSV